MKVRKPGELTDNEKLNLKVEIRAGCRNMGVNTMYSPPGQRVGMHPRDSFGLCADCGHFAFAATQYTIKWALCEQHEKMLFKLSENDPVIECSAYYTKGEQDAHDYSKNAWLLDPDGNKVGLI
jgi:hypothetical protein